MIIFIKKFKFNRYVNIASKYCIKILFCSILFLSKVAAQNYQEALPSITIGVGYFGELLTHPGITIFSELTLNKKQTQLLTRLNLIYYRHQRHTKNYAIIPELVLRRNTKRNNIWELALGTGTLYQRADIPVYEYIDGNFRQAKSGWFYFLPTISARYGRRFSVNNNHYFTSSVGGRFFYLYPFNDFWLPRAAVDLSIAYQIK